MKTELKITPKRLSGVAAAALVGFTSLRKFLAFSPNFHLDPQVTINGVPSRKRLWQPKLINLQIAIKALKL